MIHNTFTNMVSTPNVKIIRLYADYCVLSASRAFIFIGWEIIHKEQFLIKTSPCVEFMFLQFWNINLTTNFVILCWRLKLLCVAETHHPLVLASPTKAPPPLQPALYLTINNASTDFKDTVGRESASWFVGPVSDLTKFVARLSRQA